jgi:hypothetical protein
MAKKGKRRCDTLPVLHPDAAGIDVGASELYVAVSADRDPQPVRCFPTFTRDLYALAGEWRSCSFHSAGIEAHRYTDQRQGFSTHSPTHKFDRLARLPRTLAVPAVL